MIYSKKVLDKIYLNSIGKIIFNNSINEAFNIEDNKMTIMVRNRKEDRINHHRSFKLKTNKISKKYKYGIPIIFDLEKNGDENIWKWKMDPDANINKKEIKLFITEKEKTFIDKALQYAGLDMLEYWNLDFKNKEDQQRIDQLNAKYSKGNIL